MRSVERELIPGVVVVALGSAVLFSPDVVAFYLSHDAKLEANTITELQVFRLLAVIFGGLLIIGLLAWHMDKQAHWRRLIEHDYSTWRDPSLSYRRENMGFLHLATLGLWLLVLGVLATIILSFNYYETAWFNILAFEGGMWEYMQFFCVAIAGASLLIGVLRRWHASLWSEKTGGLLFALLLIVVAGEEVSWGQQWFGFATPEAFNKINVQGETTLHHLGGYWVDHLSAVFMFNYLVVWPLLGYIYPQIHYIMHRFSIPAAPLCVTPVALLALFMDEHPLVASLWMDPPWRLSEGRETLFAACILVSTLLFLRLPPDAHSTLRGE